MFIGALRPDLTRIITDRIRDRAEENGRGRDEIKVFAMLSIIVDETEEKAKAKYEEYRKYVNLDLRRPLSAAGPAWTFPSSTKTRYSTM